MPLPSPLFYFSFFTFLMLFSVSCYMIACRQPSECISPWEKIMVIFTESLCFVPMCNFSYLPILQALLRSTTKCVSVKSAFTLGEFSPILLWKLTLQMTQVVGMVRDLGRRRPARCERDTYPDGSGSESVRSWTCCRADRLSK